MDYLLRPFIFPSDVDTLLEIERSRFKDPFIRGQIYFYQKRYGTRGSFVAEVDGEMIGYVLVVKEDERRYHIYSLAVRREFEGQGIASELLRHHIDFVRREGGDHIILEVRESNERARHIYSREGFRETCVIDDYYDDGEPAIQMEMKLS